MWHFLLILTLTTSVVHQTYTEIGKTITFITLHEPDNNSSQKATRLYLYIVSEQMFRKSTN